MHHISFDTVDCHNALVNGKSVIGSGDCGDDAEGNKVEAVCEGHWFGDLRSDGSTDMRSRI
jgi:hypothetical protein